MKFTKELKNGIFIFIGISAIFFLMKLLGLEKVSHLRILNIIVVYFGMRQSLKTNLQENKIDFGVNLLSIIVTGTIGVLISVIALYIFIFWNGGEPYLQNLSVGYFTGAKPTVIEYCFGIFNEAIASVIVLVLPIMQIWKIDKDKMVITK